MSKNKRINQENTSGTLVDFLSKEEVIQEETVDAIAPEVIEEPAPIEEAPVEIAQDIPVKEEVVVISQEEVNPEIKVETTKRSGQIILITRNGCVIKENGNNVRLYNYKYTEGYKVGDVIEF